MNRKSMTIYTIILIVLVVTIYYMQLPEYKIYKSISGEGADYKETDLYVIVYKSFNLEKTTKKIVSQYTKMNGTPNKLTIWLFRNEYDANHGNEFMAYEYANGKLIKKS